MKILKGDTVIVIRGKDRGKEAKVVQSFPRDQRVILDGLNLRKRHQRPRRSGEKGQILEIAAPLAVSNVKLRCPKCGQAARVGYLIHDRARIRVCKKCNQEIT